MTIDTPPTPYNPSLRSSDFPRMGPRRDAVRLDTVRSKLVAPQGQAVGRNRAIQSPDWTIMQKLSDSTTQDIRDVQSLYQLLPDTELAAQILVSSILSPKDMLQTELHYSVDGDRFTSELSGALIQVVRDHFTNEHKIIEALPTMLKDSLFMTGSYPVAILPESTIDEAINSNVRVGMESLVKEFDPETKQLHSIGLLGNPKPINASTSAVSDNVPSFESYYNTLVERKDYRLLPSQVESKLMYAVTDNYNVLKLPILKDKMRADQVQSALSKRGYASESFQKDDANSVYRNRQYTFTPVMTMRSAKETGKKTFGHPLVMKFPSESVIPVHVPGNPKEHLGYFVLVDVYGNPVSRVDEMDQYQQMGQSMGTMNRDQAISQEIQRLHTATFGTTDQKSEEARELERLYADLVEHQLLARLKAGVYGDEVEIARDPEIYRLMFARAAAAKRTQLLYIPRELMVYVAFDYNAHGIGQSLMSKSKIIAGIRAMLMLADAKAALKNAVGRTKIRVGLDEKDPNPSQTVEFALHEYAKVNAGSFPLGVGNAQDLMNYLQRASVDVEVSGNTAYPTTSFDVEDVQANRARPDQEFTNDLRRRHIQTFGLSPETVDQSQGADFATTVVSNNLLMSKRILMYQQVFGKFITSYVRTYVMNSETLMTELREIIEDGRERMSEDEVETLQEGQTREAVNVQNAAISNIVATAPSQPSAKINDGKANDVQPSAPAAVTATLKEKQIKSRREWLTDRIKSAGLDAVIMDFISSLYVELPAPDALALTTQMTAFDAYKQGLEVAINAYISEEYITDGEIGDELSPYVERIKKSLIAYYLRRYMRENAILPELDELTQWDEEDGPTINLLALNEQHVEAIGRSVLDYAKALKQAKDASEADRSALGDTGEASGSSSGWDDSAAGDAGGDSSADADMGFDDTADATTEEADQTETSETEEVEETTTSTETDDTGDADASDDAAETDTSEE